MSKEIKPWLDENSIWKTEATYWSWLRGGLRKLWSDYPLRKEWKKNALRPVKPEEKKAKVFHSSTKNVGQCSFCGEWFPGSKLEVDHKIPSDGCVSVETAEAFLWYCAGTNSRDFQLSCKPCHKIKTHAERYGMTFEEARVEKDSIAFEKLPIASQRRFFEQRGVDVPTSNPKRRKAYKTIMLEESKNVD